MEWPQELSYRTGAYEDAEFRDYEFHGSWISQCPVCGALVPDREQVHKDWHLRTT